MFVASIFSVTLCLSTACQITPVDLLELVENRAVASLDYGDRHPQVLELDQLIAERLAAGEAFDLARARSQLDALIEERQVMGKTLGHGHRQMILNAIRIRAVSAVLENSEDSPLSSSDNSPAQAQATKSPSTRTDTETKRHELASQLRGKWKMEADSGNVIDPMASHQLTIDNSLLREEYSGDELARVPPERLEAYQAPWVYFTYHRNLHALEFRKMIVSTKNEWKPTLGRRYVSIKDDKLILVFRDDVKLLPRNLESNDENHVYYYDR